MEEIIIAEIVRPQGVRGEVKVRAFTDTAGDLEKFNRVYIGGNAYKILKVKGDKTGEFAVLALSGVADRDAAELLRGKTLCVPASEAPALPEDTYYIADVIGCEVVCGGDILGRVTDITPAKTDVYELETPEGKKVLFAAAEGVIEHIDVINKRVEVHPKRFQEVALEV